MICMSGTPTIIPNVTRSRESWRTSLKATARRRRSAEENLPGFSAAKFFGPRRHHEHVFEARVGVRYLRIDAVLFQQCAQLDLGVLHLAVGEHAQPDAELRHAVHPRQLANESRCFA